MYDAILRKIKQYRDTKTNTIFDMFYHADLDKIESCIELVKSMDSHIILCNKCTGTGRENKSVDPYLRCNSCKGSGRLNIQSVVTPYGEEIIND